MNTGFGPWLFGMSLGARPLGGMLGMASGIFIVPILALFGGVDLHTAIGTSNALMSKRPSRISVCRTLMAGRAHRLDHLEDGLIHPTVAEFIPTILGGLAPLAKQRTQDVPSTRSGSDFVDRD